MVSVSKNYHLKKRPPKSLNAALEVLRDSQIFGGNFFVPKILNMVQKQDFLNLLKFLVINF